ncbi:hypothetical protein DAETH_24360 [Deinococcus aetherius]|uniref:UDP-X diphosphatase-like N-terminal oligomerisation domain-containing protein n=1 Tax=Deinococcus aetherius TaxID=200252 RepID=A0ABM8AFB7_9DEIO|nr:NUDIX hydrolase N-terminal domain-containing protein [Deinococcus aetherius]BDP42467.1 hypothetical protein DAETH_24360 [Deinococcus aetherius]
MTHPHLIADELRALALLGLTYVRDPYDLDRYRRVLALSAELAAQDSPARLGEVKGAYLEARGVGWHGWDALPELHPGHAASLRIARAALDSGTPYFDPEPAREWHEQARPGGTTPQRRSLRVRLVRLLMQASFRALLRG